METPADSPGSPVAPIPSARPRPLLIAARAALYTLSALALPACLLTTVAYFTSAPVLLAQLSPFRVQYAVLLAALGVCCLALKRSKLAMIFALFVGFNLWAVLRTALPEPITFTDASRPPVKILLANVLTENRDPVRLLALIAAEKPDLVALLEINRRWQTELSTALGDDFPHTIFHAREDNFGLALLSRRPLAESRVEFFADPELPSLSILFPHGDSAIRVLLTHPMPPGSQTGTDLRDRHLSELLNWVRDAKGPGRTADASDRTPAPPVLLLGDFNATPWCPPLRRLLAEAQLRPASSGHALIASTWPTTIPFLRIPLDHALLDERLASPAFRVGPDIGSDHFPLILKVVPKASM
jgi:endonuclease/exonuclease/phosphatase (EEP) superfamily protein YafD